MGFGYIAPFGARARKYRQNLIMVAIFLISVQAGRKACLSLFRQSKAQSF